MQGVSVFLVLGILAKWSCNGVFLNHRPFPTYSLENMPSTQFTCREKILGGYYADPDTQCQMFHICVKVAGVGVQDFRFLCPNGTAFDQDHQICADWEDVDCDATTLYYSSDNFDLYRIGSGFESKAHRYGEDEETFALQRAETGDARINREPQTQVVNQQQDYQKTQTRRNFNNIKNRNNNQEKEIFRASSSSNFFNNRNNGKETDEDYDDNVNVNQNHDYEQKRKVIRKQFRRPVSQNNDQTPAPQPQPQAPSINRNGNNRQAVTEVQKTPEAPTRRPQRPTGFVNNYAGNSYIPTTQRSTTTTSNGDQYTTASNNNNFRRGQRQRNNNAGSFVPLNQNNNLSTPIYTVSTPAPFRQSFATNNQKNNGQYYTTTTENYPPSRSSNAAGNNNQNYDIPKVTKSTENYPSNNPRYSNPTTALANTQYNTAFDKKPTSPKKFDTKPTTFSPNAKPFSIPSTFNTQQNTQSISSFPTTFAPRTQQAYTQIAQQTNSYNTQNAQQTNTFSQQNAQQTNTYNQQTSSYNTQKTQSTNGFNQQKSSTFGQPFSSPSTTQRSTTFTQYTPTVPKLTVTTPVSRSNRFDETQYDDGSYDSRYDSSGGEDEFLKTAHSQNIASNRNEFAKIQKQHQQPTTSTTQKPYDSSKAYYTTTYAPRQTETYSKATQLTVTRNSPVTQRPVENKQQEPAAKPATKKVKSVSYDYAYYDSLGPEPDYQLDTEIKKSNLKN